MTDDLVGRLRKLLALATPRPWLIHSEPDVNYPATIHAVSTHRLGGVGDPIEPFGPWDQQLAVEAVNALPALVARIEALEAALRDADANLAAMPFGNQSGRLVAWHKVTRQSIRAALTPEAPHAD